MYEPEYEFQVNIDGVDYGMDVLTDVHIKHPLFDKFDVGLVCSAQMKVSYYIKQGIEPSRGAKLIPQYRLKGSSDAWKQLGIFYIDLRTEREGKKTLTCYDSIVKADARFIPADEATEEDEEEETSSEWPRSMLSVALEIAERLGTPLDPRTEISPYYMLEDPKDDSMRTLLSYIASAHAGNWIVTSDAKLLLVPLTSSAPPETNYLVTEYGSPILIGGHRILV